MWNCQSGRRTPNQTRHQSPRSATVKKNLSRSFSLSLSPVNFCLSKTWVWKEAGLCNLWGNSISAQAPIWNILCKSNLGPGDSDKASKWFWIMMRAKLLLLLQKVFVFILNVPVPYSESNTCRKVCLAAVLLPREGRAGGKMSSKSSVSTPHSQHNQTRSGWY